MRIDECLKNLHRWTVTEKSRGWSLSSRQHYERLFLMIFCNSEFPSEAQAKHTRTSDRAI